MRPTDCPPSLRAHPLTTEAARELVEDGRAKGWRVEVDEAADYPKPGDVITCYTLTKQPNAAVWARITVKIVGGAATVATLADWYARTNSDRSRPGLYVAQAEMQRVELVGRKVERK